MASIIRTTVINSSADQVWAAVRDFGALHERLVPGFVVDCRLGEDGARVVTFFNGAVAREVLLGVSEQERRLAYSVVESRLGFAHNSASVQVTADGAGRSRLTWITDLRPDELAAPVGELMDRGIAAMHEALEAAGRRH
jgi:carbon monoxide dehydrogenase subunit G